MEHPRCSQALSVRIALIPVILIMSVLVGVILSPKMFPGGCVYFLIATLLLLAAVRCLKFAAMCCFTTSSWAWRPKKTGLPMSPGFPSSHVSVMSFFATVLLISQSSSQQTQRLTAGVIVILLTIPVCIERYASGCHTLLQIQAGLLFGAIAGCSYNQCI